MKKHMARLVALCLTMGLLCAVLPAARAEDYVVASGRCGDGLIWRLFNVGELIISGEGAMTDFTAYYYAPWFVRCEAVTTVTIEKGVTSIGRYAFSCCSNLSLISIPSSVTSIGDDAFKSCASLALITIPVSVASIGERAFSGCTAMSSVIICGASTIGNEAFDGCTSLSSVILPDTVISIGDRAFRACSNLTSITIGVCVASIGACAFEGCSALTGVNYKGSQAQWDSITIGEGNEALLSGSGFQYSGTGEPPAADQPGDLNHDGAVNMKDAVLLMRYIAGGYGVVLS